MKHRCYDWMQSANFWFVTSFCFNAFNQYYSICLSSVVLYSPFNAIVNPIYSLFFVGSGTSRRKTLWFNCNLTASTLIIFNMTSSNIWKLHTNFSFSPLCATLSTLCNFNHVLQLSCWLQFVIDVTLHTPALEQQCWNINGALRSLLLSECNMCCWCCWHWGTCMIWFSFQQFPPPSWYFWMKGGGRM